MQIIIGIIAFLLLAISLAVLFSEDLEETPEKSIRERKRPFYYLLLLGFLLMGMTMYSFNKSFHETVEENKKIQAEQQKNATYYEVTEETVKQIESYCKEKHRKHSTQNTCKRRIEWSLKTGKESEGFTPSDVVVKASGVAPN